MKNERNLYEKLDIGHLVIHNNVLYNVNPKQLIFDKDNLRNYRSPYGVNEPRKIDGVGFIAYKVNYETPGYLHEAHYKIEQKKGQELKFKEKLLNFDEKGDYRNKTFPQYVFYINAKKIIYFPGAALRAGVIANLGHPDGVNAKTT